MSQLRTIGIVSPGAMGSSLGRCWAAGGARVVATTAGRSARTVSLADGLELLPSLAEVIAAADLVVSVAPPAWAVLIAADIASAALAQGANPLVLDLNAIAPDTVREVAEELSRAGCELVDGSISGPPPGPSRPEPTRVYLSGPAAHRVAELPLPRVELRIVADTLGTASAVKMCTASVYKGLAALLAQSLQTAARHGVTDLVLADIGQDLPEHVQHAGQLIASAASKSDRYPGEMREIARTQAAAGAGGELFEAMAAVYEAMHRSRLATLTPEAASTASDLGEILAALADRN